MKIRRLGGACRNLIPADNRDCAGLYLGLGEVINSTSPHPRAFAALALHHLVALLEQTFAFAIFAFLFLLYVRAFFTHHESLLPLESGQLALCMGCAWREHAAFLVR